MFFMCTEGFEKCSVPLNWGIYSSYLVHQLLAPVSEAHC